MPIARSSAFGRKSSALCIRRLLALGIGGFLGVTVALVLSQGFVPRRVELVMKNVIELLAAIPSVVYGLWGIFVLVPAVRGPSGWLNEHAGFDSVRLLDALERPWDLAGVARCCRS